MTNIATHYSRESIAHQRRQEVACPRCMEPCGWCSDPRWMHATLNLPGTKRKCTIAGLEPEGAGCPVCHGRQRVMMTRTYEALPAPPEQSAAGHPVAVDGGKQAPQRSETERSTNNPPAINRSGEP